MTPQCLVDSRGPVLLINGTKDKREIRDKPWSLLDSSDNTPFDSCGQNWSIFKLWTGLVVKLIVKLIVFSLSGEFSNCQQGLENLFPFCGVSSQSCLSFFLSRQFVEIPNEIFLVGVRRYICVLVQSESGSGERQDGGCLSFVICPFPLLTTWILLPQQFQINIWTENGIISSLFPPNIAWAAV